MAEPGMITIAMPLPAAQRETAQAILETWGNPAGATPDSDLATRLAATRIHFISAHALDLDSDARLYVEISGDGTDQEILTELAREMAPEWRNLFQCSLGHVPDDLPEYLLAHHIDIGVRRGVAPGLAFRGVPGATAANIRRQSDLAREVTELLGSQPPHLSGLQRIAAVRNVLAARANSEWTLTPPATPQPRDPKASTGDIVKALVPGFVKTFLARALVIAGLFAVAVAVVHCALWWPVFREIGPLRAGLSVFAVLVVAAILGLLGVLVWLASIVVRLTRLEATDPAVDSAPDARIDNAIFARENACAQNHMISITRRKPGRVRETTLRLAFWIIGALAGIKYRPGFLGSIGTIHFARWVALPDSDRLIFTSNYGGSWESYLEDFITLAHHGLTAVWSNTVNFPKTTLLFRKGATDGERFKRFARRSMVPTPFWYTAYPDLTTANIRTNVEIHRGLATVRTEDEARTWLTLFGSAARPVPKLATDEIQSLVFGGLGFLHNASLLLATLGEAPEDARECLRRLAPSIAFNDGKRFDGVEVVTLAMSAGGLAKLGLDDAALAGFPTAFTAGMTGPGRDRILGDHGANAKEEWAWGGAGEPDLAILVFGPGEDAQRPALANTVRAIVAATGGAVVAEIPLDDARSGQPEPFGFVDGISQPVIRDTYRGLKTPDPLHIVEPGEFVLGYPDNRGNLPPVPLMAAAQDPDRLLPLAAEPATADPADARPRAFALNGSYLVIRQLAQDVGGFRRYCEAEAAKVADRLGPPYQVTPEFIGAKLVGRWPNGSSLVRHPYDPAQRRDAMLQRTITHPPEGTPLPAGPAPDPIRPDNDFLYGTEDPQALRCPFGAHTRRANPRDSLAPGSRDQIDISNRHRILRVGRRYTDGDEQGLMFMCLNGDLERQFEFIQQTWLGSPSFHGLSCEQDALVGSGDVSCNGFTIPSHEGPIRLSPLARFVTMRGGGYFFLPSRSLVQYLSRSPTITRTETPLTT